VDLQEALEVEDGHLLRLRYDKELAERGVRQDVLLVVETVLLDVVHDATGDIRAAHLRALGLAKEDAERIRNLLGLGEDRGLLGKGVARLIQEGRTRTLAATSLLNLAGKALLQLLHVGKDRAERVAELIDLGDLSVELSNKVELGLRLSGSRRGGDDSSSGGRRYRGGGRSGRRLATACRSGGGRGNYGCGLLLLGGSLRGLGYSRGVL